MSRRRPSSLRPEGDLPGQSGSKISRLPPLAPVVRLRASCLRGEVGVPIDRSRGLNGLEPRSGTDPERYPAFPIGWSTDFGGDPSELGRDTDAQIRIGERRYDLTDRFTDRVIADRFDRRDRRSSGGQSADRRCDVGPLVHDVDRSPLDKGEPSRGQHVFHNTRAPRVALLHAGRPCVGEDNSMTFKKCGIRPRCS